MDKHTVFQKGFDALNRRDVEAFLDVCHPDCELQPFLRARDDDAPYRSRDGVLQWFQATDAAFDQVHHEVVDVQESNGALVALGTLHYRGKVSGIAVTSPVGWLLEFADGRIARSRTYIEPERALDEADFGSYATAIAA